MSDEKPDAVGERLGSVGSGSGASLVLTERPEHRGVSTKSQSKGKRISREPAASLVHPSYMEPQKVPRKVKKSGEGR